MSWTSSPPGVGGVEALIPGEGLVGGNGDSRMEEGIWVLQGVGTLGLLRHTGIWGVGFLGGKM